MPLAAIRRSRIPPGSKNTDTGKGTEISSTEAIAADSWATEVVESPPLIFVTNDPSDLKFIKIKLLRGQVSRVWSKRDETLVPPPKLKSISSSEKYADCRCHRSSQRRHGHPINSRPKLLKSSLEAKKIDINHAD